MRNLLFNKKAQLGTLQTIVSTLVVIGIFLGIGFMVLEEFSGQMDSNSAAQNATNDTIEALGTVPTWLGTIVLLSIVGILLAILFTVLPRAGVSAV